MLSPLTKESLRSLIRCLVFLVSQSITVALLAGVIMTVPHATHAIRVDAMTRVDPMTHVVRVDPMTSVVRVMIKFIQCLLTSGRSMDHGRGCFWIVPKDAGYINVVIRFLVFLDLVIVHLVVVVLATTEVRRSTG